MAVRERVRLPKQPEWDGLWQGWTAKYIRKHRAMADDTDEFQDLMHDAYLIFRYVKATYPLVTEPKHLMALYQTALRNEFIDKSQKKRQKNALEVSLEHVMGEDLKLIDTLGELNNEGYLKVLIDELPQEVKTLLSIFNDEAMLAKLRKEPTQTKLGALAGIPPKRITMNGALCRLLGLPLNTNLRELLRSALME